MKIFNKKPFILAFGLALLLPVATLCAQDNGETGIKLNHELQKPGYGEGGGSGGALLPEGIELPPHEDIGSTEQEIPLEEGEFISREYTGKLKIKGKGEKMKITLSVKKDKTYTVTLAEPTLLPVVQKLKNKNVTVTARFADEESQAQATELCITDCQKAKK